MSGPYPITVYTQLFANALRTAEEEGLFEPSPQQRVPRVPSCHPDRAYVAKGLCESCYNQQRPPRKPKQPRVRTKRWKTKVT